MTIPRGSYSQTANSKYNEDFQESKQDAQPKPSVEDRRRSSNADGLLDILGYQSELTRSRSTLTVAFMSFVLASVPYGLSTTLYYPLVAGGPVDIIWGWVAVCNVMITLSVNFGTTLLIVGCVNIFTDDQGNGIWTAENYHYYLVFFAITLLCNLISSLGNKWLPLLDTITIFWTFTGVIAIVVCCLAIAREGRHNASYVFGHFENSSGWPDGWAFFIGLLHGAYATSATGMILSMCEEVQEPATQVPKAMTGALLMNFLCGFVFLVSLVFVLPDIALILGSPYGQPLPVILHSAVGSQGGAFALTIPIIVLSILCGTCCTTASSRCTWAFARDGAIPGSGWWKIVDKRLDVPLNAMIMIMVVELGLGLIWFGSSAAFNAFSGCGVIFLTIAYVMPIIMSVLEGRRSLEAGHYDFKIFGWICNIVAIAWSMLTTPLFSMPATIPVDSETMNYASVVFASGMAISLLWYFAWGLKNYRGPPAKDEQEVIRRRSE
ncbi:hypothetical protein DV736_g6183, partial [Chaetothyriales sp. CBS 134916]